MKYPEIEIAGKSYKIRKPKARDWSEFAKFEQTRKNIAVSEYVDRLCEFLSTLFEDLTPDDLLDNLDLNEVQKLYKDCANCFWDLLSGKFEELEKN